MSEAERLDNIEKKLAELEKQIQAQPKIIEKYLTKIIAENIKSTLPR